MDILCELQRYIGTMNYKNKWQEWVKILCALFQIYIYIYIYIYIRIEILEIMEETFSKSDESIFLASDSTYI